MTRLPLCSDKRSPACTIRTTPPPADWLDCGAGPQSLPQLSTWTSIAVAPERHWPDSTTCAAAYEGADSAAPVVASKRLASSTARGRRRSIAPDVGATPLRLSRQQNDTGSELSLAAQIGARWMCAVPN